MNVEITLEDYTRWLGELYAEKERWKKAAWQADALVAERDAEIAALKGATP